MSYIENAKDDTIIAGTSENDTITNYGNRVIINASDGNDQINNIFGDNVTIDTGNGNDRVQIGGGNNLLINLGEGNDNFYNRRIRKHKKWYNIFGDGYENA